MHIAVIGAGEPDATTDPVAEAVGAGIAAAGAILVCGGLGGVMEAACRGAQRDGGVTIGLLPGVDRADANPFLTVALPTGLGELRNGLIVRAADSVIAVGGGWGTLSEIGFALKLGRPVVGLSTWDLSRGGERSDAIEVVDDPARAVERAVARASH